MDALLLGALAGALFGLLAVAVRWGLTRGVPAEVGATVTSVIGFAVVAVIAVVTGAFADPIDTRDVLVFAAIGAAVPGLSQVAFVHAIRLAGAARAAVLIGVSAAALLHPRGDLPGREPQRRPRGRRALIVAAGASLSFERVRPPATGRSARCSRCSAPASSASATRSSAGHPKTRRWIRWCAPSPRWRPPRSCSAPGRGSSSGTALRCRCAARSRHSRPAGICLGVAYLCLIVALDRGRVTVVAPLNATQSLWGVIFAATLLGKREAVGPRLIAAALLVVAGGVLIGISR